MKQYCMFVCVYACSEQLFLSDIITGVHVEDSCKHILILEGLKEAGVRFMWEEFPRHYSQNVAVLKVFYNSEFEFSQRLYGSLDVDLPRIVLCSPLSEILQQPLIYLPGSIPQACLRCARMCYYLVRPSCMET